MRWICTAATGPNRQLPKNSDSSGRKTAGALRYRHIRLLCGDELHPHGGALRIQTMEGIMSFFIRLLETTDVSRCQLEEVQKIQSMLNGRMTRDEYTAFMVDLYQIVLHFCPITETAIRLCPDELADVRLYLSQKIAVEAGHEKMILNDLAAFAVDEQLVAANRPSYPVQTMLAYNYYACEHIHPCCVIGMLYALELILSVYGSQWAAAVACGLQMPSENGFTFLDSRSAMDLNHVSELRALLQKIESPAVQQIIIDAIQMNFYLLITFLKG